MVWKGSNRKIVKYFWKLKYCHTEKFSKRTDWLKKKKKVKDRINDLEDAEKLSKGVEEKGENIREKLNIMDTLIQEPQCSSSKISRRRKQKQTNKEWKIKS